MNVRLAVDTEEEARQLAAGFAVPEVRAFVRVMGILYSLKSDRDRVRVLSSVIDHFGHLGEAGKCG